MKRLIFYWNQLKSTFWFVPIVFICVAICLAFAMLYIDSQIKFTVNAYTQYMFAGSAESARSILSTISGAMIGVAGTVFSITLVGLSLASTQFGPRLVKNFMYDRFNQIVLGTYIATFAYCLLVLNTINENDSITFIPVLSIIFALMAALANIILLVFFIHHISTSIQADTVIADLSASLARQIKTIFPESIGEAEPERKILDEEAYKSSYKNQCDLRAQHSGYLQYIDSDALLDFAMEKDGLIELYKRPGDYVVANALIAKLYLDEEMEKEEIQRLRGKFITGKTRTHEQDAEHAIHQMVEVAARALSPGVNDPYTAISCIDNLTSILCYLAKTPFPSKYRKDKNDELRVITDTFTFDGMVDAAFNQIRQFSENSPAVVIRLMESFDTLIDFTQNETQVRTIQRHAHMVLNMAKRSFKEENDLEDLIKRSQKVLG
ncbi:MAG: DUF2254 domain-containing protein [Cyclobacteriaceae bacterium]|nr:DUF2254 domain-containing protein [Cyclobacteriaceae bacterium]